MFQTCAGGASTRRLPSEVCFNMCSRLKCVSNLPVWRLFRCYRLESVSESRWWTFCTTRFTPEGCFHVRLHKQFPVRSVFQPCACGAKHKHGSHLKVFQTCSYGVCASRFQFDRCSRLALAANTSKLKFEECLKQVLASRRTSKIQEVFPV